RTVFCSKGCVKRRSTRTTTVLSFLSLTTTPCNTRFGISVTSSSLGAGGVLLARDGLDARDVAPDLSYPRRVLKLARGRLKAQVELLLLELDQLVIELIDCHAAHLCRLHGPQASTMRETTRVLSGSLAAPSRSDSRATASVTPSISNITRPGFTRATQNSGVPLPLPMRTSVGFFDTGTSGNTRIHTRPARFICRVIARRAASICRAVMRAGSWALRPCEPKLKLMALDAAPLMRPLWALRYFVRFGCNMTVQSVVQACACGASRRPVERPPSCASSARCSCAMGSWAMISPLKIHTLTPMMP